MRNARFGLMVGVAGAALSLLAASSYGQTYNPPTTTDPGVSAQTPSTPDANATTSQQQPSTPSASANSPATAAPATGTDVTGSRTTTTTTDVTTPATGSTTFAFGPVAIVIIALIVILLLWALLRPRDRTVVRDNYSSATTTRNAGTGTTTERVVSPRAAGGTETTTRTNETDTRL